MLDRRVLLALPLALVACKRGASAEPAVAPARSLKALAPFPVGVCAKCGERYYRADILRKLDLMAQGKVGTIRHISVPLADFALVS